MNAALLLARLAMMANCYEDAKAILEKITETAPRFIAVWHDLSTVLKELHQYDDAVTVLERALQIDPDNPLSHYYHGAALAMAARPAEAVSPIKRPSTSIPSCRVPILVLGHVLKTVGDQEGGIAPYRRAIELRPDFGETYYSLANLKTFRFTEQDVETMSR